MCLHNWNLSIQFFLVVSKLIIPFYFTITQLCIKSICSYIPKRCIKFDFLDTRVVEPVDTISTT